MFVGGSCSHLSQSIPVNEVSVRFRSRDDVVSDSWNRSSPHLITDWWSMHLSCQSSHDELFRNIFCFYWLWVLADLALMWFPPVPVCFLRNISGFSFTVSASPMVKWEFFPTHISSLAWTWNFDWNLICLGGAGSGGFGTIFSIFSLWKWSFLKTIFTIYKDITKQRLEDYWNIPLLPMWVMTTENQPNKGRVETKQK